MGARSKILSLFFGLTATLAIFPSNQVWACGPQLTAEALCNESGQLVINFGVWYPLGNPRIDILFNGVKVGQGALIGPEFGFSGSAPYPATTGPVTVTAMAVGVWADGTAPGQSDSIVVPYPTEPCGQAAFGRFTGGGHQVRVGDVRVTRGLTIHCDLLLSNNLEVNWGGNQFHMTEHLTTVACTDDEMIDQFPPEAPLDTLIGVGTGRYNGADGYTIEFTLVDYGEPGSSDQMAIRIFESASPGNVVLNVPLQVLSGGNLQAHYDQPHM